MRHRRPYAIVIALILAFLPQLPVDAAATKDLFLTGGASPVAGERRLALVIGNATYTGDGIQPLKNPVNDANAMSSTLKDLGFDVRELVDADRDSIRDAVHDFASDIRKSPQDVVALLYYSGHGMQVAGQNYLVPIGFDMPKDPDDIGDYAYPVQKALGEMEGASARVNIVILDACRSNPYEKTRAIGEGGLARMEARGIFIAYATDEGKTADDNPDSANGLYTGELLKAMKTPGLRLYDVFQIVRKNVYEASGHDQYPFDYNGLLDANFYFDGKPDVTPTPIPTTPTDTEDRDALRPDAEGNESRGDWLLNESNYAGAERFFREAARLDPTKAIYQFEVGIDLLDQGKYVDAEPFFREAVRLDPTDGFYHHNLGVCLSDQERYGDAEAELRAAVDRFPSFDDYHDDLGVALFELKRYADAETEFREAVRLNANDARNQHDLATALSSQGKYDDAEPYYREAAKLAPNKPAYQNELGIDLYQQKKYDDAVTSFKAAVQLEAGNAEFQANLGNAYFQQGLYTDAEPYYAEAVRLQPSNTTYSSELTACKQKLGES